MLWAEEQGTILNSISTRHRFFPVPKESRACNSKCQGRKQAFATSKKIPETSQQMLSKPDIKYNLRLNDPATGSAFTQQNEILEVPASSHVFHTRVGGGQSKTYSLFSLQSILLPVNQELQPVTQLALWWLCYQLLGILKKTKTNYTRAVTHQILLQVYQAIGQLCWRTCQYIRDLLHLFPNHPLTQRIFSYSNDSSFHPTEHPPPLHLPQAGIAEELFAFSSEGKIRS